MDDGTVVDWKAIRNAMLIFYWDGTNGAKLGRVFKRCKDYIFRLKYAQPRVINSQYEITNILNEQKI